MACSKSHPAAARHPLLGERAVLFSCDEAIGIENGSADQDQGGGGEGVVGGGQFGGEQRLGAVGFVVQVGELALVEAAERGKLARGGFAAEGEEEGAAEASVEVSRRQLAEDAGGEALREFERKLRRWRR